MAKGIGIGKMGFGEWAFILFLLVIAGLSFFPAMLGTFGPLLAGVLALVVVVMNITKKESMKTLLAGLVLAFVGASFLSTAFGQVLGLHIESLLFNIGTYFVLIPVFLAIKVIAFRAKD